MTDTNQLTTESVRHTWWPPQFSLATGLCLVIGVAGIIVAAAYWLYWNNDNRKYDLARPGQQGTNQILGIENNEADTNSPVTSEAAEQKIKDFIKEIEALESLGQFDPADLNDQAIQLAPPEQPSL